MNPDVFESLKSRKIRRINDIETTFWLHKPLPIKKIDTRNPLKQESEDAEESDNFDTEEIPPPLTLNNFILDAYLAKREKESHKANSFDAEADTYPIFQTDEDYQASQTDDYQFEQEKLMVYLQNEDDFPSMTSDYDDFEGSGTSSETFSGQPATSDMLWKGFRIKEKLSHDSGKPLTNDDDKVAIPICSSLQRQLNTQGLEEVFEKRSDSFKSTQFETNVFGKTFKLILEISKNLDERRQVITSNNKDIMIPQLNKFCFPIWTYFKRRRCNTL